nr:unnamed protein product [Callosobruchus chinensis]
MTQIVVGVLRNERLGSVSGVYSRCFGILYYAAQKGAIAQIAGPDLSQDFRIQRFFEGIYMLRPALPKYENTWNPSTLLVYLRNLHILIINLELLQTSARNRPQPFLRLPYLVDDPGVCVAKTLLMYLEKTRSLRGSVNQFIVTTKKPHYKASIQTISCWIKVMLRKILDTQPHLLQAEEASMLSQSGEQQVGVRVQKCLQNTIIDRYIQIRSLLNSYLALSIVQCLENDVYVWCM